MAFAVLNLLHTLLEMKNLPPTKNPFNARTFHRRLVFVFVGAGPLLRLCARRPEIRRGAPLSGTRSRSEPQTRLRVKQTLHDWFEEYRMYHRDENGNPVKIMDDLLSATRYALMMKRHAKPGVIGPPLRPYAAGEPLRHPYRGPQKSATEAFFDVYHRRGYP